MVVKTCTHNAKFFHQNTFQVICSHFKFLVRGSTTTLKEKVYVQGQRSKPWFEVKGKGYNSKRSPKYECVHLRKLFSFFGNFQLSMELHENFLGLSFVAPFSNVKVMYAYRKNFYTKIRLR